MSRFIFTVGLFLGSFFLTASASQGLNQKDQNRKDLKTFTFALNWKPEPQFGGFYQAQLDQDFQKNKLEVKILEGGSGTPTIQMLVFKKVDVAIVSAEEILISNDRNPQEPVIALFAVYQTNPQILMTRQERGLKSIEDLLNTPGTLAAQSGLTYVAYLKKKYPQNKVRWVPYLGGITGLLQQKDFSQQGFLTSEPLLAEKQGLKVSTFLVADEGFNPYTTVVAVRKSDFELRKNDYVTLIRSLRSGWQKYLSDPSKTNQHMAQINKALDIATFTKSAEAQKPLILTQKADLGSMTEARWADLIRTLKDLKILKNNLKASDQFLQVD